MPEVLDAPTAPPSAGGCRCHNCGADLVGPFCHACGQQDLPLELPAREILRGALGDVFAWDGRFWVSTRLLLRRPGYLAREWADGRRGRYVPPLRLFVIVSLLFVGINATYAVAKDWLDVPIGHDDADTHGEDAAEGAEPTRFEAAGRQYVQAAFGLGHQWFFLLMPLGGFGLYVLYHGRRPSYASHFVVAIHVFSVVVLVIGALRLVRLGYVLVPPHERLSHAHSALDTLLMVGAFLGSYAYAALSVKRFYGVGTWKAVASAPAVLVAPVVVGAGILLAGMLLVFAWVASGG